MAHVDPRSVRIEFTSDAPRPGEPTYSPYGDGFAVPLMDRLFTASAEATIAGSPGEVTGPWTFGFIQMMWVQTWWAHYKGIEQNDGSVFINFARAERIAGSSTFPSVLRDTADHFTERLWINDTAAPGAIAGGHYIDVVPEGTAVPMRSHRSCLGTGQ